MCLALLSNAGNDSAGKLLLIYVLGSGTWPVLTLAEDQTTVQRSLTDPWLLKWPFQSVKMCLNAL